MHVALNDVVKATADRDHATIERACEMAIQGGRCGVRVERRNGLLVSARPDPEVPYGEIHEHLT